MISSLDTTKNYLQKYDKNGKGEKEWYKYDKNNNCIYHKTLDYCCNSKPYIKESFLKYNKDNKIISQKTCFEKEDVIDIYKYDKKGNCIFKIIFGIKNISKYNNENDEIYCNYYNNTLKDLQNMNI